MALVASLFGWPVSTTHSIVGAIVGFAAVGISVDAVNWGKVGTIVASWVTSPLMSGTLAFFLFKSVQRLILNQENPLEKAKTYVPILYVLDRFLDRNGHLRERIKASWIGLIRRGSHHLLFSIGAAIALLGKLALSRIQPDPGSESQNRFSNVERVFGVLCIITACAMAFAHGSNDVANAVGPLAAINSIVENGGTIVQKSAMPVWILFLGGAGIVIGLATLGYKVIATIGKKITDLTPSRAFAAELAAAGTVVLATYLGRACINHPYPRRRRARVLVWPAALSRSTSGWSAQSSPLGS